MSERVYWHGIGRVHPDQMAAYRALIAEVMHVIETEEPGTLFYDVYLAADGRVTLNEHYRNSAAALQHLMSFGPRFGMRYATLVEVESITVYGPCSEQLKAVTDSMGAMYAPERLGVVERP